MERCILCWLKKMNKRSSHLNLISERRNVGVCDICQITPFAPRYTYNEALFDPKNIVYGITITLSPKVQKIPIEKVHQVLSFVCKKVLRNRKTSGAVNLWAELTPGGLHLHYHGWIAARRLVSTKLNGLFKRGFGFIKISQISDLERWETYCKKQQLIDELELEPIMITS